MFVRKEAINTLRCLSLDMIDLANSGHPGIALGAAPTIFSVYNKMNINLTNDKFFNRDRFVLSAGHGSALLYAALHLFTNMLSMQDLKEFRKIGSITPGHPQVGITPFVDASTGPLGQGVANSVGMAIAEEHLASKFNKNGLKVFDHYTYCLASDGDFMEGIAKEALSLAGTLRLNKLIILYDSNDATIEGNLSLTSIENTKRVYKAKGFNVVTVNDANSEFWIMQAIDRCKRSKKPSIIIINSVLGYGSQKAGKSEAHGFPFGETITKITKQTLGMSTERFYVSENVKKYFENIRASKLKFAEEQNDILNRYEKEHPAYYAELKKYLNNDYSLKFNFKDERTQNVSTKQAGCTILNEVSAKFPNVIGGSADVAPSTMQSIKNGGDFSAESPGGKNIHFGIREAAMSGICNGIALHGGLKVFCSAFLAFSDYMKNGIRMSALMKLPVVYLFSSDSIGAAEDGASHQSSEQLVMLRATPNLNVFRPADFKEAEACYELAFTASATPSVIALTKQKVDALKETDFLKAKQGAYIVKKERIKRIDYLIIASGSELALALEVAEELEKKGKSIRVVSMVCTRIFDEQPNAYKEKTLPAELENRVIIEAGSMYGLAKYGGLKARYFTVDDFGYSGTAAAVFEKFGFTKENIVKQLLQKNDKK